MGPPKDKCAALEQESDEFHTKSIRTFDDLVLEQDRKQTAQLEQERQGRERCPHLSKKGNWFYYCGHNLEQGIKNKFSFNLAHPFVKRHCLIKELKIYCLGGDYKSCYLLGGKGKD